MCKNHNCCYIEMLGKGNNILKYNQKSMKVSFVIYADTESSLKKQIHVITIQTGHQQQK